MRYGPKTYWYLGEAGLNFGDALNPILFQRLAGVTLRWEPSSSADLFAIGSNLHLVPTSFRGTIFGAGTPGPTERYNLSKAKVLALRGWMSAERCRVRPRLLADPGLLATDLLEKRPVVDLEHGIIRHFSDGRKFKGYDIDVLGGVDFVIREAARCERISSSSLHGLILADALGIPNRWIPLRTSAHKFYDYASAFGERIKPMTWRLADQMQVADKQEALRKAFMSCL